MSEPRGGLRIRAERQPNGVLVRVGGDVDLRSSPDLRKTLLDVLEEARPARLVVDLSQVPYMDSSGVGTLVELKRVVARAGGKLVLAGLQPRVRSVLEITQLTRFFDIEELPQGAATPRERPE